MFWIKFNYGWYDIDFRAIIFKGIMIPPSVELYLHVPIQDMYESARTVSNEINMMTADDMVMQAAVILT